MAELVNSIAGTNAGKVIESEEDGMVIYTVRSTRGIEKISPYLLCEWKRIDAMQSHKDRDIRPIHSVEEVEGGGSARDIKVQGGFFQLANRLVCPDGST